MDYTVIVAANASVSAAEQFWHMCRPRLSLIFPQQGPGCLGVFDDLTKHAPAYGKFPLAAASVGREAYRVMSSTCTPAAGTGCKAK